MARRRVDPPRDEVPASGLGSMLRGSVNTVVGAAGLNLPLRAVERLTAAVEQASSVLERLERASTRLDELDDGFLARVDASLDHLAAIQRDIAAIRSRVDRIEAGRQPARGPAQRTAATGSARGRPTSRRTSR